MIRFLKTFFNFLKTITKSDFFYINSSRYLYNFRERSYNYGCKTPKQLSWQSNALVTRRSQVRPLFSAYEKHLKVYKTRLLSACFTFLFYKLFHFHRISLTLSYSDTTLSNGILKLNYNDNTLLGKLSNVLDNEEKTLKLIIILPIELIDKPFIAFKKWKCINRSILVFKTKTN